MATAPVIDVANLVAIQCKVKAFTVPEKTRHKAYAVEALAAVVEHFNSLNESKKINEHTCRTDYVHGSTRAYIFEIGCSQGRGRVISRKMLIVTSRRL